jgi:hypothetical protein
MALPHSPDGDSLLVELQKRFLSKSFGSLHVFLSLRGLDQTLGPLASVSAGVDVETGSQHLGNVACHSPGVLLLSGESLR